MRQTLYITSLVFCIYFSTNAQNEKKDYSVTKKEQIIKVFPNPATNVINILGLFNSNNANIIIIDSYGNIVKKYYWEIKNSAINIPVSSLETGVYNVLITSKEQNIKPKFYKK